MRTLTVAEHISLDGVVQAPGGPEEDTSGDFRLGGWIVPYGDPGISREVMDTLERPFELLLGRKTYEIWAAYWPNVPTGDRIGDKFNAATKHVATHRDDRLGWRGSQALGGDLTEAVRALKQSDGANLLTWGSADVVRQLLAAGLVDELRLIVYPLVLGRGKRVFSDASTPTAFRLAHSSFTPRGVQIARYEKDGAVERGSFGAA